MDFDKNMVDLSAALKADTLSAESVRFLPIEEADDEVQGKLLGITVLQRKTML